MRTWCLQASADALAAAEEAKREQAEVIARLEAHVHDLESSKRAPLYQKKQEAELQAAHDKAKEAEARACEAEVKARDAKASHLLRDSVMHPQPVHNHQSTTSAEKPIEC